MMQAMAIITLTEAGLVFLLYERKRCDAGEILYIILILYVTLTFFIIDN